MGLIGTIGLLLPLAAATALSTVPLAVVTVILLSRRGRGNGLAYLIGLTVGVFAVTFGLSLGIGAIPQSAGSPRSGLIVAGEILLGAALIAYGLIAFFRRPAPTGRSGRWTRALDRTPMWSALGVGLLMSLRPKALLLSAGAGVAIAKADLDLGTALIAVGIYTLVSVSTVAVPVIFTLANPMRARRWLMLVKRFITQHGRGLSVVVGGRIGSVMIGDGLSRL